MPTLKTLNFKNKSFHSFLHVSAEVNLTGYILIKVHHNVSIIVSSFVSDPGSARNRVFVSTARCPRLGADVTSLIQMGHILNAIDTRTFQAREWLPPLGGGVSRMSSQVLLFRKTETTMMTAPRHKLPNHPVNKFEQEQSSAQDGVTTSSAAAA